MVAALSAQDVLDLSEGRLNPAFCKKDKWGSGDAARIEGGDGDHLTLTGGKWREVDDVTNVPDNYDVFARQTSSGTAYVIVDEDIQSIWPDRAVAGAGGAVAPPPFVARPA